MQSSLLVALILLAHPPPPSRAVILTAKCEVPASEPCPEAPSKDDIFPEAIFLQAHRAHFKDGVMPEVLDLRAFAVFQRRHPGYSGFISGLPCTYTIVSDITGQHPLVPREANPSTAMFRWMRTYILPPVLPDTWCDFDRDNDVDLDDFAVLLGRWFAGTSVGGGGDGE